MNDLLARDAQYVWHPFTQMKTAGSPLVITGASGSYYIDDAGNKYLDCNSSWWTNVHGHGEPRIGKAIAEQYQKLDHIIFAGATHPAAIEVSERVVKLLPDALQKVFFSDNGSTSVEVALKMAFQYWYNKETVKKRVLALDGAYHGDTFGAMSVGQRGYFNKPFEHLFFEVDFLDFPTPENEQELLSQAEVLFKTGEFAALILEPLVQGSAGMRMYSVSFLEALSRLARNHGVLVIFDEVMTGWGRTGKLFAMDHCTIAPDIVCLSKGLTGGILPLGLTVATTEVFDAFLDEEKTKALLHGHSFTGNAISCAAACANLSIFDEKETFERIEQICNAHAAFLEKLKTDKRVTNLRQRGTILAFEIVMKEPDGYFSRLFEYIHRFFLDEGMFIRPLGNTLFLNPPYSFTSEQLQHVYAAIGRLLDRIEEDFKQV